jgi:hypothetical protein
MDKGVMDEAIDNGKIDKGTIDKGGRRGREEGRKGRRDKVGEERVRVRSVSAVRHHPHCTA